MNEIIIDGSALNDGQSCAFMCAKEFIDKYLSDHFLVCQELERLIARHLSVISRFFSLPVVRYKAGCGKVVKAHHKFAVAELLGRLGSFDGCNSVFKFLNIGISMAEAGASLICKMNRAEITRFCGFGIRPILWENCRS